jgi:uncharacterized damage-inducible protein DinB
MSSHRNVRTLARYNAWANQQIFDAVAVLPAGEAAKPRRTRFKSIVHTLNHNLVIDQIFQAHLQAREHGFAARNTSSHPSLEELWAAQRDIDGWYIRWSDESTEESLEQPVRFTFVGGGEGIMTREQMLMHVVNHSSYHRGFVAEMFNQVPARPPTMDLPVFLRDVPLKLA